MRRRTQLILFALVVIVQLYIPASTIWDMEEVLEVGEVYLFETVPVDPKDPFRGNFIRLAFRENAIQVPNTDQWKRGEMVFVELGKTTDGFARIEGVNRIKPLGPHMEAKVDYVNMSGDSSELSINYSFDRFFMEESKAPEAEILYREAQRDSSSRTWAKVRIYNGTPVLEGVFIDGVSIVELAEGTARVQRDSLKLP